MSKAHKQPTSRATQFTCHAPSAQVVFLAGTFNAWDSSATPMIKDTKGNWAVAVASRQVATNSSSSSMAPGAAR